MRASRCLALNYIAELSSPTTLTRLGFTNVPALDWTAPPRPNPPEGSATSNSFSAIPVNDDDFLEEGDDPDMESASMNSPSGPDDPIQEAEWEDEWRASYNEAIDTAGRGVPVHLNSMKQNRSPRSEDKVSDYFRRCMGDHATN